jgi:hypothetical protein
MTSIPAILNRCVKYSSDRMKYASSASIQNAVLARVLSLMTMTPPGVRACHTRIDNPQLLHQHHPDDDDSHHATTTTTTATTATTKQQYCYTYATESLQTVDHVTVGEVADDPLKPDDVVGRICWSKLLHTNRLQGIRVTSWRSGRHSDGGVAMRTYRRERNEAASPPSSHAVTHLNSTRKSLVDGAT